MCAKHDIQFILFLLFAKDTNYFKGETSPQSDSDKEGEYTTERGNTEG
jgi:hypothetical protein